MESTNFHHSRSIQCEVRVFRSLSFVELEKARIQATQEVQSSKKRMILILAEPEPTFTAGRGASEGDLLWNAQERQVWGVKTVRVGRGGLWTYHGPGQIVIYPILKLQEVFGSTRKVSAFLEHLRNSIILWLSQHKISATRGNRPFGIYVGEAKLASFGISVERGVSSHGLALYGAKQATYFRGIRGCGVSDQEITSLEELGASFDWHATVNSLIPYLESAFQP